MEILIDTHIFLWLAVSPQKISKNNLEHLQDRKNRLLLSAMSVAELKIKESVGQIDIPFDILEAAEKMGIELLDFDGASAVKLGTLPMHHKDPFDRMLIAQAITHRLTLCTVDGKITRYKKEGLELL